MQYGAMGLTGDVANVHFKKRVIYLPYDYTAYRLRIGIKESFTLPAMVLTRPSVPILSGVLDLLKRENNLNQIPVSGHESGN